MLTIQVAALFQKPATARGHARAAWSKLAKAGMRAPQSAGSGVVFRQWVHGMVPTV
ncbi:MULTISPECIES: hypothetical protein [unclassified Mesorhizobium]|uniref:hypothetical protein n=1 Tax=unclassified Mesorhizobium TaxID=325217 RepID=UPI0013DF337B|nr:MULTISPECIES: hypothetical protein [unclassified Mesorhizobium]